MKVTPRETPMAWVRSGGTMEEEFKIDSVFVLKSSIDTSAVNGNGKALQGAPSG